MMDRFDRKSVVAGGWYVISNIIAKSIVVLFTPVLTRVLSKDAYGEYSNFMSWFNILAIICTGNLSSTVLRAKIDYKTPKQFNTYIGSVMIFSISMAGVVCGILALLMKQMEITVAAFPESFLFPLVLMVIFSSQLPIVQTKARALLEYKKVAVLTIAYAVCTMLFPIAAIYLNGTCLESVLWGISANSVIWGIGLLVFELVGEWHGIDWQCIRYALVFGVPLIPHILSGILLGNSDKIMISSYCGADAVAIYSVAHTCAMALLLLRNSIASAWAPWFYKKIEQGDNNAAKEASKVFVYGGALVVVVISLLSPEIIYLLAGSRYNESSLILPILLLGCFYDFINLLYINIEFYFKKTGVISVITMIALLFNIILNYYGLQKIGYFAAGYTTAISSAIALWLHYFVTRKYNNYLFIENRSVILSILFCTFFLLNLNAVYDFNTLRICLAFFCISFLLVRIRKIYRQFGGNLGACK